MDGSYQAIRDAALDVARAAQRAEYRRQQSQSRSRTRQAARKNQSSRIGIAGMPGVEEADTPTAEGSPDLRARSAMFDSFHSDMSAMTDGSTESVSASQRRHQNQHLQRRQLMSMSTPALVVGRGRSMRRAALGHPGDEEGDEISGLPNEGGRGVVQMRETRSQSKSRSLSLARGSGRRAAGVAFMSLGILAGWSGGGRASQSRSVARGIVLAGQVPSRALPTPLHPCLLSLSAGMSAPAEPRNPYITTLIPSDSASTFVKPPPGPHDDEPPDYKRIIGRISAWTCTTLYLTSRLPQIWKNVSISLASRRREER